MWRSALRYFAPRALPCRPLLQPSLVVSSSRPASLLSPLLIDGHFASVLRSVHALCSKQADRPLEKVQNRGPPRLLLPLPLFLLLLAPLLFLFLLHQAHLLWAWRGIDLGPLNLAGFVSVFNVQLEILHGDLSAAVSVHYLELLLAPLNVLGLNHVHKHELLEDELGLLDPAVAVDVELAEVLHGDLLLQDLLKGFGLLFLDEVVGDVAQHSTYAYDSEQDVERANYPTPVGVEAVVPVADGGACNNSEIKALRQGRFLGFRGLLVIIIDKYHANNEDTDHDQESRSQLDDKVGQDCPRQVGEVGAAFLRCLPQARADALPFHLFF
mmetsp:Transcript_4885/g.10236  ORF Transcript_4885/g.10236 Transcript_4885/m.10236 type:complete len:326 (-) Transcript_4885:862-1839(-)